MTPHSVPAAAPPRVGVLISNLIANLSSGLWTVAISVIFVPVYIGYLGIEAWGLIGFSVTLQAVIAVADLGLGTTINREMARAPADADPQHRHDLLRTLEVLYWTMAVIVGVGLALIASFVATRWLQLQHLPIATARNAIRLMGLVTMLQMPMTLYAGGLMGLQQQVRLNVIHIVMVTLRTVGMVLVLALVSPSVMAYFLWQAVLSAAHTWVLAGQLRRQLGAPPRRARARRAALLQVWRFSAGVMGISITATLLFQLDKIVLSRLLPLDRFGYYAFAAAVAASLYRITMPAFTSCFPRLTELAASGNIEELRHTYHAACQLTTVIVMPIGAVLALFSVEILSLWTRNTVTTASTHLLVTLLVISSAVNALLTIPTALQYAHGWTRLGFWTNLLAAAVLAPLVIITTPRFGAEGAAMCWVLLSVVLTVVTIHMVHRRLLPGDARRWYIDDVGKPVAAAVAVAIVARLVLPSSAGAVVQIIALGMTLILSMSAAGFAAPLMRPLADAILARMLKPATL